MTKTKTIIDEHAERILDVVEHMIAYDGRIALCDARSVRLRVAGLLTAKDAQQIADLVLSRMEEHRVW